ncbi:integral membrane protein [Penicillium brasilianum]|uniref:Integral membrane protein n=1 Tax=Penicillium brasilianum TaxID=104259 RepID=A0A1S9RT56_PENBI|nr:integral membrane protein [Penicillium brasilianum]
MEAAMETIGARELSAERKAYLAQSRIPEIIICNVVLIVFSTGGMLVRLFVRLRYLTGINLDDMICIASWAFTFVLCFTAMLMTKYGFGKHIGTVSNFSDRAMFLQLDFVTMLAYVLALGTIKMSFCLLYLHIFPGKKFRACCWWLLAIIVAHTISETLVVLFQCTPVHKAWDATGLVEGTCVDMNIFYYANFAVKLASDLALFTLPIPKVVQLRMSVGKRIGLVVMFSLGLLVCMTSIIRISYLNSFKVDHTWSMVDAMNWSCVEVAVAIFIACIPSFNTLITHRFPKLQRLLGLPSSKEDTSTASKYGSSSRRTYNSISLEARKGLKLGSHIGESRVDVITTLNGSQERIMHAGIQVTTDVSVNDKSV